MDKKIIVLIVIIAVVFVSATYYVTYWVLGSEYLKDEKYCKTDLDCVRQASCCDCDLGDYVNRYHYKPINCEFTCECITIPSRGVCQNNACIPVIDELVCEKHTDFDQDFCYYEAAIRNEDISLCEKIKDNALKEDCKRSFGG